MGNIQMTDLYQCPYSALPQYLNLTFIVIVRVSVCVCAYLQCNKEWESISQCIFSSLCFNKCFLCSLSARIKLAAAEGQNRALVLFIASLECAYREFDTTTSDRMKPKLKTAFSFSSFITHLHKVSSISLMIIVNFERVNPSGWILFQLKSFCLLFFLLVKCDWHFNYLHRLLCSSIISQQPNCDDIIDKSPSMRFSLQAS